MINLHALAREVQARGYEEVKSNDVRVVSYQKGSRSSHDGGLLLITTGPHNRDWLCARVGISAFYNSTSELLHVEMSNEHCFDQMAMMSWIWKAEVRVQQAMQHLLGRTGG